MPVSIRSSPLSATTVRRVDAEPLFESGCLCEVSLVDRADTVDEQFNSEACNAFEVSDRVDLHGSVDLNAETKKTCKCMKFLHPPWKIQMADTCSAS